MTWERTFVGKQEALSVYWEGFSYKKYHKVYFGIDIDYNFRYVDTQFFYWSKDRAKVQQALGDNPLKAMAFCNKSLYKISIDFLNYCKNANRIDYSPKTDEEIWLLFREWYEEFAKTYCGFTVPLEIEPVLTKLLSDHLQQFIDPAKDFALFSSLLSLFFLPSQNVDLVKEKKDLISLAAAIKKEMVQLNSFPTKFKRKIENHRQKYAWMGLFLLSGIPWSFENVLHRLQEEMTKDPQQSLLQMEEKKRMEEQKLQEFMAKIQENEFKQLIYLAREISFLRTFHAEKATEACYYSRPLLQEVARRMNLSYNDFIYLLPQEIDNFFNKNKNINIAEIKQRQQAYVFVNKPKMEIFTGAVVEKFKKEHEQKVTAVRELRGSPANIGFVKGIVKVIKDKSELPKVQKGDILVAQLTTPDFVPAMERAAAFITDTGGITSHAAIIAREFNKPCIVGTEIATKVLKDGDVVEVDATNGVVKIIKK